MERFELCDKSTREKYLAYKTDGEWQRVYSFLSCRALWHVTTNVAWEAIKLSRAIKPNVDAKYDMRFEFETEHSFGYMHQYVNLFDFFTASQEEVIQVWGFAWDILTDDVPTVLLQLNWQRLRSELIPNTVASDSHGHIPYCEVWYPGDIPTSAINAVYIVPAPSEFGEFRPKKIGMIESVEPVQRLSDGDPLDWLPEEVRRNL